MAEIRSWVITISPIYLTLMLSSPSYNSDNTTAVSLSLSIHATKLHLSPPSPLHLSHSQSDLRNKIVVVKIGYWVSTPWASKSSCKLKKNTDWNSNRINQKTSSHFLPWKPLNISYITSPFTGVHCRRKPIKNHVLVSQKVWVPKIKK